MFNLIKMDSYRLVHARVTKVIMFFVVALAVFSVVMTDTDLEMMKDDPAYMNGYETEESAAEDERETVSVGIAVFPTDEWVTGDIELGDMISVQVQSKLLLILCSIFTALFISGEQKHGYIKNIAGLFPGREKLILSKAVVLAMQVTVMLAVFTVVMVITGFVLWGDRLYMGDVGDFVCMLGVQYLLHLGFSMAVAFLCVLSGSSAFGMTAGIIVCTGLLLPVYGLINNAVNSMTSGADFEIARYMPDGCISMAGTDAGSDTMITAVIVGLAFFAVTALLSMMIMRKRDIH